MQLIIVFILYPATFLYFLTVAPEHLLPFLRENYTSIPCEHQFLVNELVHCWILGVEAVCTPSNQGVSC